MSSTEEILAQIDSALEDNTVSEDAMRCNGPEEDPPFTVFPGRVVMVNLSANLANAPTLEDLERAGAVVTFSWSETDADPLSDLEAARDMYRRRSESG